ncbi:hypothetical protein HQ32_04554, partial [Prauserella sp. Am3]
MAFSASHHSVEPGFLFITLQAGRKVGVWVFRWGGWLRPACSVMGWGQVDGMALR